MYIKVAKNTTTLYLKNAQTLKRYSAKL